MRTLLLAALLVPSLSVAKTLNVEFKFTPFTGDVKADHVDAVPGHAAVFLNGIPLADQEVEAASLPVLFDEREVAASVWMPMGSYDGLLRKGKNTIRIEFTPKDAKLTYHAQLRWASVTDQTQESDDDAGHHRSTNQANEGVDDKSATGPVSFERSFDADFATDRPWHHAAAVTTVTDEDRQQIAAFVTERAGWFKPDFAPLYKELAKLPDLHVDRVKKARCLDAAYKAGLRITAPPAESLEIATTGNPEIVVRRKGGDLFELDPAAIRKIKGDENQMCAGMSLAMLYPPRLILVRGASGGWQLVY